VEVVEPLGSETLLQVAAGGVPLVVRLPGGATPRVGEELALAVDTARVHLFSPQDGAALPGGG
jgi:ABC-type sugar transport system ATPase subunit